MEHPKTTKNVGQPCVICGQPADARAAVEALQHERDHAKKMEAVQKEVADNQTWHVRELQDWRDQVTLALQREGGARFEDVPGYVKALVSALDAEREKVKDSEAAYKKLAEQWNTTDLQLSQLQALVRALKGDANYTYHVADNPDEDDQYTVYVHVNGQGYGAIAEFYSRNEALAYAEIKRVATLPATPTGEAT